MKEGAYQQYLFEKGAVTIPLNLLEKLSSLDISPEELGYLVLAMGRCRQDKALTVPGAAGKDPWTGWALDKGWARWQDAGEDRNLAFDPLWNKLYQLWEADQAASGPAAASARTGSGFDYSRIMKALDRMRGSLSVTIREQQMIQEMNIKYGWGTEFILAFFQLCFKRGLTQIKNYKPLAEQIHRAGIHTMEGLASFMDEVDWISRKASEIKKDYLGSYGMVTLMERELYVKWSQHWHMSHSVILRAAQESVGANNASFKYIDKVLEDWHEKGVDSLERAEQVIQARTQEQQTQKAQKAAAASGLEPKKKPAADQRLVERGNKNWAGVE